MKKLLFAVAFTAGCGVDSASDGSWTVDRVTSDGAVLGVWGTSPTDVWAVGGQADQAMIWHGDGARWTPVTVGGGALLYSVYGFTATDVYAVGERGTLLHFDGQAWTRVATGTERTLFGLWGASGNDVWIVGGDMAATGATPVVLRGARETFQPVALPTDLAPDVLFKAHGFAADDVMMVGTSGAVLRWNGSDWRRDAVPTQDPLLSTWGSGTDDVYAVGGTDSGQILHSDGHAWSETVDLPTGEGLSGVFTSAEGPTIAVGPHHVFELAHDGALVQAELPAQDPALALHGVWGDLHGTTYAVGGTLDAYPSAMTGVILRRVTY